MPTLDKIQEKATFKKKPYRPWIDQLLENTPTKETNTQHLEGPYTTRAKTEINQEQFSKTTDPHSIDLSTNLGQIEDKLRANIPTKAEQIQDNIRTNQGRIEDKLETTASQNLGQYLGQTQGMSYETEDSLEGYFSLSLLQRKIVLFIFDNCNFSRNKKTSPISIQQIASNCNTTVLSAQKTIQRLVKKGVIIRFQYKQGRGGWTRYLLPDSIYQEIIYTENQNKLRTNLGHNSDKPQTEPETHLRTSSSSSSSKDILLKTTTTMSDEFSSIDLEPLFDIGFSKAHLAQIATRTTLSVEIIQDSINAFAFDLKINNKAKTLKKSPLDFFMGILGKGNPYTPPENYETPKQAAMRKYIEYKKTMIEKNNALMAQAFDLAFEEWKTSPQQTTKIQEILDSLPPAVKNVRMTREGELRRYFEENEWPIKRREIENQL